MSKKKCTKQQDEKKLKKRCPSSKKYEESYTSVINAVKAKQKKSIKIQPNHEIKGKNEDSVINFKMAKTQIKIKSKNSPYIKVSKSEKTKKISHQRSKKKKNNNKKVTNKHEIYIIKKKK